MAQASDSLKGQLVGNPQKFIFLLRGTPRLAGVQYNWLTVSGQSPPGFVTAPHNSSSSSVLAQGPRPGDSGPSSSPQVVIESDLYAPRPLELLPHRTDRRDGEGRRSGRFQNPRLQGPHPAKTPARPGRCIPALRAVGPP